MEGIVMTKEFSDDILKAHNQYRARHAAPSLKISEKLNKIAQEWSEILATKDKSEHRPNNPYGENVYMARNTDPKWILKGDTVVKAWYDEIDFYKFGETSPNNPSVVGHFTQLIWIETTDLGIGEAKSKTGRVYVVCNYDPPGNIIPEFAKNVLPISRRFKPTGDGYEKDEEIIVLTASQEKIGIQFVQPNIKIVESMERLYAVPSEKIRVWSVWLTKVEEKADEWNSWLQSNINLVLRMSEHLQRAEREMQEDEPKRTMSSHNGEQYLKDVEIKVKKASMAADAGQRFDKLSEEIPALGNEETDPSQEDAEQRDTMPGTNATEEMIEKDDEEEEEMDEGEEEKGEKEEDEEEKEKEVASSAVVEETSNEAEEMAEASTTKLENETSEKANDDEYPKDESTDEKEINLSEEDAEGTNEEETEELKKIAWPIGVAWEPVVPMATSGPEESKVPKKKDEEAKVIAIPENEEDMQRLIKEVKEQATIFRSLYKHWLEVGDKAVKEVMNRTVMDSEIVPTEQEIPYFFYVNTVPNIEIGVEHDDEKILLPDLTREKITSDFTPLYFNLTDKPGKG